MTSEDEVALIAEYERLRRELNALDSQAELLNSRLVELERILPDYYIYPDDHPEGT